MKTKVLLLKIYLRSLKRPIVAELDNEQIIDKFYDLLNSQTIVKFGQVIFDVNEFKYATIVEKIIKI